MGQHIDADAVMIGDFDPLLTQNRSTNSAHSSEQSGDIDAIHLAETEEK